MLFGCLAAATGAVHRSAIVAALFAIHPLHVEVAVWVAGRKDLLSTLFGLISLWCYIAYTKQSAGRRRKVLYAAALIAFALSLMSKQMLVTCCLVCSC